MSYRLQDQIPPNAVEERLDVHIEHPVVSPTPLPAHPQRLMRRTARPIPIGVLVEPRLHRGLQVPAHNRLRDPVRDRRHPEHSRAAVSLRYLNSTHRRREIRPRRQPIPEFVQVPVKVLLELRHRLAVNPGSALVRPDPPIGRPHGLLGDLKRLWLRLAHPAPPTRRRLTAKLTRTTLPLRSSPITGPSSLLRSGPPLCPASLLSPSQICCLGFSLQTTNRRPGPLHWSAARTGRQVPEFHTRARTTLAPLSMPDTHLANQQAPARLLPRQ